MKKEVKKFFNLADNLEITKNVKISDLVFSFKNNDLEEELIEVLEAIDEENKIDFNSLVDDIGDSKLIALGLFLELPLSKYYRIDYEYDNVYSYNNNEYIICNDDEADDLVRENAVSYIEDIVYGEIPEQYRYYFDENAFIEDYIIDNSRGEILAAYDGVENSIDFEDDYYYIYRIN